MAELCSNPATGAYWAPCSNLIAAVTQALPAQVTTNTPHNYVSGTVVRLVITPNHGMPQLNGQFAPITVTGATTFTVPIDTTNYVPFSIPVSVAPGSSTTCSQVVPMGELTSQLTAAIHNTLP
jgi:hypothetical protein